jgi:hypothetical protein
VVPGKARGEVETAYGARPEGSESKLSTFRDGWRILKTIATLYRIERPVLFFGGIGALMMLAAILLSVPLILTYLDTGLVPDGEGHGLALGALELDPHLRVRDRLAQHRADIYRGGACGLHRELMGHRQLAISGEKNCGPPAGGMNQQKQPLRRCEVLIEEMLVICFQCKGF